MADDNLFTAAAEEPKTEAQTDVDNFFEKYVGEGKKYKTPEDLAKAYAHAENHIGELKTDLTGLKDFMTAQFEQLNNRNQVTPNGLNDEDEEPTNPAPTAPLKAGEEDLETRIAKALEERDENTRLQNNAKLAQDVLVERLGSQEAAVEAVRQKAKELDVSPQFLADTAFRSPRAFFNIMGINPDDKPRSNQTPASASDVNPRTFTANPGAAKPGTYAHYDQLRKTDPKQYWKPDVQAQMQRDAASLGQDFFKR